MAPQAELPYCGFACGKVEATVREFQKCGACRLASYCSPACAKANWPSHKKMCKTMIAEHNSMEVRSMAEPEVSLTWAAFDKFVNSYLYDEIASYLTRVIYRFGFPPHLCKTHTILLRFEIDPKKTSRDSHRHQFRLIEGRILSHEEMGEEVHGPKNGEQATQRKQFIERLAKPEEVVARLPAGKSFGPVVALANFRNPTVVPQVTVSRNIFNNGMYFSPSHTKGWFEFAQKAFRAPVPFKWQDLYDLRAKEFAEPTLYEEFCAGKDLIK